MCCALRLLVSPLLTLYLTLRCVSTGKIPPDEWNLLYVAVTRARTTLVITNSIRHILTLAGVRGQRDPRAQPAYSRAPAVIQASVTSPTPS